MNAIKFEFEARSLSVMKTLEKNNVYVGRNCPL